MADDQVTAAKEHLAKSLQALGLPADVGNETEYHASVISTLHDMNLLFGSDESRKLKASEYSSDNIETILSAIEAGVEKQLKQENGSGKTSMDYLQVLTDDTLSRKQKIEFLTEDISALARPLANAKLGAIYKNNDNPGRAALAVLKLAAEGEKGEKPITHFLNAAPERIQQNLPAGVQFITNLEQNFSAVRTLLVEDTLFDQTIEAARIEALDPAKIRNDAIAVVEGTLELDVDQKWGTNEQAHFKTFIQSLQNHPYYGKPYQDEEIKTDGLWTDDFATHLQRRIEGMATKLSPQEILDMNLPRTGNRAEDLENQNLAVQEELRRRNAPFGSKEEAQRFLEAVEILKQDPSTPLVDPETVYDYETSVLTAELGMSLLRERLNGILEEANDKISQSGMGSVLEGSALADILKNGIPEFNAEDGQFGADDQNALQTALTVLSHPLVLNLKDGNPEWMWSETKGKQLLSKLSSIDKQPIATFLSDEQKAELKALAGDKNLLTFIKALNDLDEHNHLFKHPLISGKASGINSISQHVLREELERLEEAVDPEDPYPKVAAIELMDTLLYIYAPPYGINNLLPDGENNATVADIDRSIPEHERVKTFYKATREQYKRNNGGYEGFDSFFMQMLHTMQAMPFGSYYTDENRESSGHKHDLVEGLAAAARKAGDDEEAFLDGVVETMNGMIKRHGAVEMSTPLNSSPIISPSLRYNFDPIMSEGQEYTQQHMIEAYQNYLTAIDEAGAGLKDDLPSEDYGQRLLFKSDAGQNGGKEEIYVAATDRKSRIFTVEKATNLAADIEMYFSPEKMLGLSHAELNALCDPSREQELLALAEEKGLNEEQTEIIKQYRYLHMPGYDTRPHLRYLEDFAFPKMRENSVAFALAFPEGGGGFGGTPWNFRDELLGKSAYDSRINAPIPTFADVFKQTEIAAEQRLEQRKANTPNNAPITPRSTFRSTDKERRHTEYKTYRGYRDEANTLGSSSKSVPNAKAAFEERAGVQPSVAPKTPQTPLQEQFTNAPGEKPKEESAPNSEGLKSKFDKPPNAAPSEDAPTTPIPNDPEPNPNGR